MVYSKASESTLQLLFCCELRSPLLPIPKGRALNHQHFVMLIEFARNLLKQSNSDTARLRQAVGGSNRVDLANYPSPDSEHHVWKTVVSQRLGATLSKR